MNKLFLNMVMLPSALWRSLGADIDQLRAILNVRLILDDRKPMAIGRGQKKKKENSSTSILNVIFSVIFGCVYMIPLTVVADRVFSLTIYFFMLSFVMTFMLITDFSNVLFDARDKYILFSRPVNDRTLVLARMLHVFIYLFRIVFPMSLPGWIVLGYADGWKSATLFPFILILMVCFVLFLVNCVYLLVLNLTKPEKFKDIINYFQIAFSVIFFASVYLLPRLFDEKHPHDFNILDYPWVRFLPSYWLAVCWSWIGYPVPIAGTFLYSALGIIMPLLCVYFLVKWLAPQFSQKISGIDTIDVGEYKPAKTARNNNGRFYQKMAYAFNRTDDARAGFMMAWLQSSRSRSFKMRVYPSFATIPIYFVVVLMNNHTSITDGLRHSGHNIKFLMLLYMSALVMVTALTYLTMSDQYKAAWVYYAAPLAKPGRIMVGAFKAIWVKYFLPYFIVLSVFIVYMWGAEAIIDVVLALVNVTLFVSVMAWINYRHLPFSIAEQIKQSGNRIIKTFVVMIVPLILGAAHYFALKFHLLWLEFIFLALSSILLWLVLDSYSNTTWANMIKGEPE